MSRISALAVLAGTALLLGACANSARYHRPAGGHAGCRRLQPPCASGHAGPGCVVEGVAAPQIRLQRLHGVVTGVYADPTICGCLYVGDQAA